MDKLKRNIILYILLMIDFYVLPWFIIDTGSGMFILLVMIPIICFIVSILYGIRNGFDFLYLLLVGILFIPSIFIFYNLSAWIYVIGYVAIALLGNLVVLPFRKK